METRRTFEIATRHRTHLFLYLQNHILQNVRFASRDFAVAWRNFATTIPIEKFARKQIFGTDDAEQAR